MANGPKKNRPRKKKPIAFLSFVLGVHCCDDSTDKPPHCSGKGRDDLLWTNADGGHLGPPASKDSWLSGAVQRCMKADPTFPRVTAHLLRHGAASLAVSAGANVKAIQRMMGHKSAAMSLDVYADLFDDDLDVMADRLEQSVSKMRPKHA